MIQILFYPLILQTYLDYLTKQVTVLFMMMEHTFFLKIYCYIYQNKSFKFITHKNSFRITQKMQDLILWKHRSSFAQYTKYIDQDLHMLILLRMICKTNCSIRWLKTCTTVILTFVILKQWTSCFNKAVFTIM